MARASGSFKGGEGALPSALAGCADIVPPELRTIAEIFGDLQGSRHRADYDLGENYLPEDVNNLIDQVEEAMDGWKAIRDEPAARLFLLSLLVWDRIKAVK